MSGPAQNSRGSDSDAGGRIAEAVRQFESALERALDGGPTPAIDLIVAAAVESDRDLLRQNLLKSEYQWRNRAAQATIDPSASAIKSGDTNSRAPEATIELVPGKSDTSAKASNGRAGDGETDIASPDRPAIAATLPPSNPAPAVTGSDVTIDVPGGAKAPSSISPAERAAAATGVWDPNAPVQPRSQELGFTIDAVAGAVRAKAESSRPTVPGYELLSELGRGGMGVVYKAVQIRLHRVVALKMVLAGAHADADQLARFATEAEAVASLQHPNIVQIYEVGEHNGLPFFSLEFVDGQPLDKFLSAKPQPPRLAAKLMEPIARAMHFAHEQGIVHRDLKPANVLLTHDSVPKVTDFGLAKNLDSDSSQTKSGTLMGTPSYMAPEQALGRVHEIGPAADIHSLGAMLYEMLVGRPPYLGATPLETMLQVKNDEPVPPRKLIPKLSRDVETICLKCLQKEPSRRYASAGELADDLARFQNGEPIHARPISKPERAWRWCRRNPRMTALTAVASLLLVTAGAATGKLAIDASREQQASEETRKLAEQRLEQATKAISTGDHRRALDLLRGRDVRLSTAPELADVRDQWQKLQGQVESYGEFKRLLTEAHLAKLTGQRDDLRKAREILQDLIKLDHELRGREGGGAVGLPPLNPEQERLFKENEFETLLLASMVEADLFHNADDVKERANALGRAVGWVDEADGILPNIRILSVQRSTLLGLLGKHDAEQAELERAKIIDPNSAVDHFWHGVAELMRANGARAGGDTAKANALYRNAVAEFASVLRLNPRHFWGYIEWAVCHQELGEFADAVIGTTAAIEIDPDHAMAYVNRAFAQRRLGKIDEALADLAAALAIDAGCSGAYFQRGLMQLDRGHFEATLNDLSRAIEITPGFEDAWLYRAEAYRRLKQSDEALADFSHLIEIATDPTYARLRRAAFLKELARREEAMADYDAILDGHPEHRDARWHRSRLRAELNHLEDSVADLDELSRIYPDDADVLVRHAELSRKLKRNEAALADYTRLIEGQHDPAANYRRRADLHRDLGHTQEAIGDYGEVVKLNQNDTGAWLNRALLEFTSGDHAAARDDAAKVIALAPQMAPPYQIRAFANLITFKDFDASFADWQKLTELNAKDANSYYYIGAIEMGRRRYSEALTAFDRVLEFAPTHADAHWARSQTLLFQKRYEDALAEINQLIEKLAANRPAALNSRGDIYRAMGRLEDAAADYHRFFERRPAQPDNEYLEAVIHGWVCLAGVLETQGKPDEARKCYDELVKTNPGSPTALLERAQYYRASGHFRDALADCDAAAMLDPKSVLPGLARASIVAARGDYLAAVAEGENLLLGAPPGDGHVRWAAARVWSLASAAARADQENPDAAAIEASYVDRAASLLAEALDRGFHDLVYSEHNRLPFDPALTSVRRDPRVLELFGDR